MMCVDGWETRALSALADYINGHAFKPDDWGKEGLPIIRIEQLKNPDGPADYYAGRLRSAAVIDDGDLIFSWSASLFLRIWTHGRAALNQHLFKVIERDGVDRLFLKDFIEFYLPDLTKASHGSTMQHITRKELDRFAAPFPTCQHEQSKIAEVLSTVDRAIEQTEALIAKQQRIKTGLMQDLLTRGIDEDGNLRSEQTHEFKDSPLGRIPVEWDVVTVDEVACITTGDKDTQDADNAAEYPFFVRSQTVERINSYSFDGEAVLTAGDGVGTGKVFHYYCGRFDFHQRVYCMHSFSDEMLGYFFFNYFRMHFMSRVAQFSAKGSVDSVRLHMIAKMLIPKPDPTEQSQIAEVLRNAEESISRPTTALEKLRSLKTGLMQDLLRGKVRVTPLLEKEREAVTA